MNLAVIIILIIIGILLIWLEVLVIPGTTISGIGGIILIAGGVYLAFSKLGNVIGIWALVSTLFLLILSIIFFAKSNTWKKLSLNSSIDSSVEHFSEESVKQGDSAISITRLNPMGKIIVNEQTIEAESLSGLIDPETELIITEIHKSKVFVKLKK
jgi:membrane-bound ClpP family serine protease